MEPIWRSTEWYSYCYIMNGHNYHTVEWSRSNYFTFVIISMEFFADYLIDDQELLKELPALLLGRQTEPCRQPSQQQLSRQRSRQPSSQWWRQPSSKWRQLLQHWQLLHHWLLGCLLRCLDNCCRLGCLHGSVCLDRVSDHAEGWLASCLAVCLIPKSNAPFLSVDLTRWMLDNYWFWLSASWNPYCQHMITIYTRIIDHMNIYIYNIHIYIYISSNNE